MAATIERYGLLRPGQRVLAAFSGGPDSTALAIVLGTLGYEVVLGHINHGMRPESGAEAGRCRLLAADLGMDLLETEVSVARRPGSTGEAAARDARYGALEAVRVVAGAEVIATGHTLDDDAETALLRAGRGGFPLGIPPRNGRIVRPLLGSRRAQTAAACAMAGLTPVLDPSNADVAIARNRLRHTVLAGLPDDAVVALAGAATAARQAAQCAAAAVDAAMVGVVDRLDGRLRLHRAELAGLPTGLQAGLVRRCLEDLGQQPGRRLVADVVAKVVPVTGARLDLPGSGVAWSDATWLWLGPRVDAGVLPAVALASGWTQAPAWGLRVLVRSIPAPSDLRCGPEVALLDAGALTTAAGGGLELRSRRPGDRYRPLGSPGSRKLQDVLVDRKIPREQRDRLPVLTAGGAIAWVAGCPVAEAFRITPGSALAVEVRLQEDCSAQPVR